MSTALILVLVVVVLLVALMAGGYVASGRRQRAQAAALLARVEAANEELAQAHASDNGWDRAQLEMAARQAWEGIHTTDPIAELSLVEVIDRPGIDADEAVFRISGASGHEREVVLARTGDGWIAKP